VSVARNRIRKGGDDDSWEVRRPKILGIEVQGQSHGYFFYINIHTDIVGQTTLKPVRRDELW